MDKVNEKIPCLVPIRVSVSPKMEFMTPVSQGYRGDFSFPSQIPLGLPLRKGE